MPRSPEALSEFGEPWSPGPWPRLWRRAGIPLRLPVRHAQESKSHEATSLRRSEERRFQGAALRAGQELSKRTPRSPELRARSGTPTPGRRASRLLRPGRACQPPARPRRLPPNFVQLQLCSQSPGSRRPAAAAARSFPLLSVAWAAAASALPVVGEHALVDHHDQERAHAVKAGGQQLQEYGQRFGRRHPQLLLMSVCGGFRGGFSFNPGMLTSMNFRHGCGGGACEGSGGQRARAAWGSVAAARGELAGPGPVLWTRCAGRLGSPRGRRLSPPRGRDAGVHTPGDFDRALCNAGSEGRDRAWLGLGKGWRGLWEGALATLSPGRRGRGTLREPLEDTGAPGSTTHSRKEAAE